MDKIDIRKFCDALLTEYEFFAGVPDSVLKHLCLELSARLPERRFLTSANEGNAVAVCAGYTLSTGRPGVVYMQNSGLGNAVNPLLSLNDERVYSIPVLLIIGWRGEYGAGDEPQHIKQGLITENLLDVCGIPCRVLEKDTEGAVNALGWAAAELAERQSPVALLVRKDSFTKTCYGYPSNEYTATRESAIESILDEFKGRACTVISATGMISRELYALRVKRGETHANDFYNVGAMGHTSSVALGIALNSPDKTVICLDGDGAALMHMGALAAIGAAKVKNFIHVVFNNAAHDSVGGHPTCAGGLRLAKVAEICGYELREINVACRKDTDLIRPKEGLLEMKRKFTEALNG
jgi:phosphonopyruvate decarboxylase